MSGVTVAFLAQVFIGISLVIDKIFFGAAGSKKVVPYVFWIAIMSCFGLVFFFFGFTMPSVKTFMLAFFAALSFVLMLLCYYKVLSIGEVTEAVPVVGGFAPLATFIAGSLLSFTPLNAAEVVGFSFLITGGFILFFSDRSKILQIIPWTLVASAFTGSTNVLEKIVFTNTANFATGYALMKTFTLLIGISMLAFPAIRQNIFTESKSTGRGGKILYFTNRAIAGTGSLLIFYAIKLENHPAIVESINGARYVIVFIIAIMLTKLRPDLVTETIRGWRMFSKSAATLLIMTGLFGLGVQRHYESLPVPRAVDISWGVTFSELMADKLEIDSADTIRAIIHDLKPSGIRLVAYWKRIETVRGIYDFRSLDMQMNICREAGMPVILAIGHRVPRWPECHRPDWADPNKDLQRYIGVLVRRYKGYNNLVYWQVENEPFLNFGECPPADKGLLINEVDLVHSLDPGRQILMTDGGEFGDWYRASSLADIFGTTLYRKVYNRILGHLTYPLTPEFYPLKQDVVKFFSGKKDQKFIVIELGAEPWTYRHIYEMPPEEQVASFTIDELDENIRYTLRARFDTCYLWGAEWWYYLKIKHHNDSYWAYVKKLMEKDK